MARRKKLPFFLADDAPEQLLGATGTQRDRLLLLTMLCLGLRVSELCHVAVPDLDFRRRVLWVREGKGSKDRCLPIPKHLVGPLRGWIGGRRSGPVFESPRGGEVSVRAVQLLIKRVAVNAGLPEADVPRKITPHKLRHAFACRLLESGATIYDVKELMGHSSIATTEVYLHSTPQRLADVVDRVYQ